MIIGYARVSTRDQNLELQTNELKKAGCEKIFKEKVSGSVKERPELERLKQQLRPGDTIVVWKLDRLGRSLKNIIDLVLELNSIPVHIKGLTDGVDTTTVNGRLFLNIMASFAEYERELIRERTFAGLESARARGRIGGRPPGIKKDVLAKLKIMRTIYKDEGKSPKEIYKPLGLTHSSYYRYCKLLDKYTDEELEDFLIKKK